MKYTRTLLLALGLSAALSAGAVRAWQGSFRVTQPDGTELTVSRVGDERMNFLVTTDGQLVVRDAMGRYCYAHPDMAAGQMRSTGVQAVDARIRPASQAMLTRSIDNLDMEAFAAARAGKAQERTLRAVPASTRAKAPASAAATQPQYGMGRFTTDFPAKGKIKGLILLVEYADVKFNTAYDKYGTTAGDYFRDLLTKEGFDLVGGTGSATDYFQTMSMNQFQPEFTVVGPITLPNNRAYYGGNDSYGNDRNAEEMVAVACQMVDDEIDFSQFDNNGDGMCDYVFVFYAGVGEASAPEDDAVWPHSYDIRYGGFNLTLDGTTIGSYACANEWQYGSNTPDGIGTFVHEFSHVIGLPDLYQTSSGNGSHTPGAYDIMDYGPYNNNSRTPPAYCIYERNAMGWMQPELLPEVGASLELDYIVNSNHGFMATTDAQREFFLFENRQRTGWDAYIPGSGMLIWHIDYLPAAFDGNRVNNDASHSYVDLVEANNIANNNSTNVMRGYPWPGSTGATAFTSATTPAFRSWSGKSINLPITNIRHEGGKVTFDVNGGYKLSTPVIDETIAADANGFLASWAPVDGATDYRLTVYGVDGAGRETTETADMGSVASKVELPTGWVSTTTSPYATNGNYGAAIPALRFAESGSISTRVYNGDITSFSFWCKGQGSKPVTSTIAVEAQKAGSTAWTKIEGFVPAATAVTHTFTSQIPEGTRAMRISFTKDVGNLSVDDISATYIDEVAEPHPDFQEYVTGGRTQVSVPKMAAYTRYKFRVTATDGEFDSDPTAFRYLDIPAGVDNIAADPSQSFAVATDGRVLTVYTSEPEVDVYDAYGRRITSEQPSDGSVTFALPSQGLYIVRAGANAAKVLAH